MILNILYSSLDMLITIVITIKIAYVKFKLQENFSQTVLLNFTISTVGIFSSSLMLDKTSGTNFGLRSLGVSVAHVALSKLPLGLLIAHKGYKIKKLVFCIVGS